LGRLSDGLIQRTTVLMKLTLLSVLGVSAALLAQANNVGGHDSLIMGGIGLAVAIQTWTATQLIGVTSRVTAVEARLSSITAATEEIAKIHQELGEIRDMMRVHLSRQFQIDSPEARQLNKKTPRSPEKDEKP